ncbi:hypothetical protein V6S67_05005 [Arthrobacter sp. Soc17.1.1.1]|uniref:hypothetical protein n=1 Tax=Arthrobacter sp. Soc17.1.1.1 TaxID=3121277 RepID=UPI002FE4AFA3
MAKNGAFDGQTDDTAPLRAALQAATHALELGGRTTLVSGLSFPRGNLTVRNATIIVGAQTANASFGAGITHDSLDGVTYENVTFTLAAGANPSAMVRALAFVNCRNVSFKSCRFRGFTGNAMYSSGTQIVLVDDCGF